MANPNFNSYRLLREQGETAADASKRRQQQDAAKRAARKTKTSAAKSKAATIAKAKALRKSAAQPFDINDHYMVRSSHDLVPYEVGMPGGKFYMTREWANARYQIFLRDGRTCACCGQTKGVFHIDHIQPRSLFPNKELDLNNLQVLCALCNIGKGNKDKTDWRPGAKASAPYHG